MLNTKGKVLIDDFKYHDNLCFHSLIISDTPLGDSIRENFKSREGKYYSFINFKKEFAQWLHGKFLHVLSPDHILSCSFENITFWTEADGWKSDPKKLFMRKNYALLQERFNELKNHQCDFQILEEDLNRFIFDSKFFEEYFDNCGNAKSWENPILNVIISHKLHGALVQDHFEFLRTSKGYKLLCVSMRSANLK